MSASEDVAPMRGNKVVTLLPYAAAIASGVWAFAGAFLDLLSPQQRLAIACIVFTLIAAGAVAHWRERRERLAIAAKLEEIADLDEAIPRRAISDIAEMLFVRNAVWRLTVYVVESPDGGTWRLRQLVRRSANQAFALSGRTDIPLDKSILRGIWNVRLPHGEPTSEAPDPISAAEDWFRWQASILQDHETVRSLRMKSRRYAWCATREPDGEERTIAMVAETLEPDGIRIDSLESPLIFSSLLMIARWLELRDVVGSAAREGAKAIQTMQR